MRARFCAFGERSAARRCHRITRTTSSSSSKTTGQVVKDVQSWVRHPVIRWMAATLDGIVEGSGAVFEAKFMLPWSFSEEMAAERHMAQLQHNMCVTNAKTPYPSIITAAAHRT